MENQLPIEVCPMSNMMTLGLSSLQEHPVLSAIAAMVPFSINTDDTVVFDVTLSQEIQRVALFLKWTESDVLSFSKNLVNQIVDRDPEVRSFILSKIEEFENNQKISLVCSLYFSVLDVRI